MKLLKLLIFILMSVVGFFGVLMLLGPKGESFERSIIVEAPPQQVFEYINSLQDLSKWNPWSEMDPDMKKNYVGEEGAIGSSYHWESDHPDVGTGKQTIMEIIPNKEISTLLQFTAPFESESTSKIELKPLEGDRTEVSWSLQTDFPIFQRPIFLFMDIESEVGANYEKGLASLRKLIERASENAAVIETTTFEETLFLVQKGFTSMEEFDTYFTQTSENLTQLTEEFGIETSGSLYAFYYSWDTLAQKSELAIGFAINELPSLPEALDTIRIPQHNAFLSTHIGDYSAIENVHVAINLHADQRNIVLEMPAIEHYVVDHRTEEDSTRWLTEIIYLTKP